MKNNKPFSLGFSGQQAGLMSGKVSSLPGPRQVLFRKSGLAEKDISAFDQPKDFPAILFRISSVGDIGDFRAPGDM